MLFPVRLLEEVEIPLEFEHVQAAQLMDWQPEESHSGFNQFVQDIARVLGPPPGPKPEYESPPDGEGQGGQDGRRQESEPSTPPIQSLRYILIGIGLLLVIGAIVVYGIVSQGPSPSPPIAKSDEPSPKQSQETTPPPAPAPSEKPPSNPPKETPTVPPATKEVQTTVPKPQPSAGPAKNITGKDGAPMVLILAGEFWMGSPDGKGNNDEHPQQRVYVDTYYMDKFEVSVSRYTEFMQLTGRGAPNYWDQVNTVRHSNLPVVGVDWYDAEAYCRWAEKRLPTEAEWEKAARSTDGRTYPWGNEPPTSRLANFGKGAAKNVYDERLAPIDSYEAGNSPHGIHHMAGNVWEWTTDWYDEHLYAKSPQRNPKGPSNGTDKVLRGGGWGNDLASVRSAYRARQTPTTRGVKHGFRCAQDSSK